MCDHSHTLLPFTSCCTVAHVPGEPQTSPVSLFLDQDMVRWVLDTGPIQDEGSKDASGPPRGLAFLEYHIANPAEVLV